MDNKNLNSEFKSKVNNASKSARSTVDSASDSATDMLETVTEFGKNFFNSMSGSKEKAIEAATTTLSSLDKTIRQKPMAFLGGAVALGFVAGYFLGKTRREPISTSLRSGVDRIKQEIDKNINKVSEHLQ